MITKRSVKRGYSQRVFSSEFRDLNTYFGQQTAGICADSPFPRLIQHQEPQPESCWEEPMLDRYLCGPNRLLETGDI